jgi:steroid 5-alpha reductase family enzyme
VVPAQGSALTTAAFNFELWLSALPVLLVAATITWLVSLPLRNVAIVDSLWSLMFFAAGVVYALGADPRAPRLALVLWLLAIWAARLSFHITVRSIGKGEDRRYQAIRARNQPRFAFKSLYLVFWLQALLAWFISLPLLGAFASNTPLGWLDYLGVSLWVAGFIFEAGGDWQLSRFKKNPGNADAVMNRGLWRYTRHPNYFGEFCIWWGFWLMAVSAGGWWSLPGPALLTLMLLRVSGVSLLEKDIGNRRPQYADYVLKTNAFFPGPTRK